ncbi:hypothetical protein C4K38_2981 [Pseudomonas chlororaphis subsp. piscium]|nr:hypothetical protein C4K38_2981 [Pseudomonas chlororaphis subsp. piscium]
MAGPCNRLLMKPAESSMDRRLLFARRFLPCLAPGDGII